MDAFYEESALNRNEASGKRIYQILHILSMIFLWIGILLLVVFFVYFPWQAPTLEEQALQLIFGFVGVVGVLCLLTWFLFSKFRFRYNRDK